MYNYRQSVIGILFLHPIGLQFCSVQVSVFRVHSVNL